VRYQISYDSWRILWDHLSCKWERKWTESSPILFAKLVQSLCASPCSPYTHRAEQFGRDVVWSRRLPRLHRRRRGWPFQLPPRTGSRLPPMFLFVVFGVGMCIGFSQYSRQRSVISGQCTPLTVSDQFHCWTCFVNLFTVENMPFESFRFWCSSISSHTPSKWFRSELRNAFLTVCTEQSPESSCASRSERASRE